MFAERDYRFILKRELEKRCAKNPRYSLRAFARDLGLSSARVSEILNEKSGLSREKAEELSAILGFNKEETDYFCNLVESVHGRSAIKRELASARLMKFKNVEYTSLEADHFKMISDWYHFAILELTEVQGFKSDAQWIARALGIQEIEAKLAIERLFRLGFLEMKRNRYIQTHEFMAIASATPSESLRHFHRQILKKAEAAIDLQSIDDRDLGAMIMAINAKDIDTLKVKIREFRKTLNQYAQQATTKNRVYCLATQFFELTEK